MNIVTAAISPPGEETGQFSSLRPGDGMAVNFASSVPAITFPVGEEGEKDFGGNLGVHRHLPRYSTRLVSAMYSNERKRFPQELFLPGFPTRDQTKARD